MNKKRTMDEYRQTKDTVYRQPTSHDSIKKKTLDEYIKDMAEGYAQHVKNVLNDDDADYPPLSYEDWKDIKEGDDQ